jgi:hypothetical protein
VVLLRECEGSISEEVKGKGKFFLGTPKEVEESGDQG